MRPKNMPKTNYIAGVYLGQHLDKHLLEPYLRSEVKTWISREVLISHELLDDQHDRKCTRFMIECEGQTELRMPPNKFGDKFGPVQYNTVGNDTAHNTWNKLCIHDNKDKKMTKKRGEYLTPIYQPPVTAIKMLVSDDIKSTSTSPNQQTMYTNVDIKSPTISPIQQLIISSAITTNAKGDVKDTKSPTTSVTPSFTISTPIVLNIGPPKTHESYINYCIQLAGVNNINIDRVVAYIESNHKDDYDNYFNISTGLLNTIETTNKQNYKRHNESKLCARQETDHKVFDTACDLMLNAKSLYEYLKSCINIKLQLKLQSYMSHNIKLTIPPTDRVTDEMHKDLSDRSNDKCYCCSSSITITTGINGHINARQMGGMCTKENLRLVCAKCNLAMGTMNMIEYIIETREYGKLFIDEQDIYTDLCNYACYTNLIRLTLGNLDSVNIESGCRNKVRQYLTDNKTRELLLRVGLCNIICQYSST